MLRTRARNRGSSGDAAYETGGVIRDGRLHGDCDGAGRPVRDAMFQTTGETTHDNRIQPKWEREPVPSVESNRLFTDRYINTGRFVCRNIVACVQSNGALSIWCTSSAQCMESISFKKIMLGKEICKISDSEFVVSSREGHLYWFTHVHGTRVQQVKRTFMAHRSHITDSTMCDGLLVTAGVDARAIVWSVATKTRVGTLYHDHAVSNVAISSRYIVTYIIGCEVRVYGREEGFPLRHVFPLKSSFRLKFLSDAVLSYHDAERGSLVLYDVDAHKVSGDLEVGITMVPDYEALDDGRIVIAGVPSGGGMVLTVPMWFRELVLSRRIQ